MRFSCLFYPLIITFALLYLSFSFFLSIPLSLSLLFISLFNSRPLSLYLIIYLTPSLSLFHYLTPSQSLSLYFIIYLTPSLSLFHYLTPSLSLPLLHIQLPLFWSLSLSLSISFSNSLFSSSSTYLSSFLKMGLTWSLFCYFSFFSNTDFTEKNCRSQRDSNSGRRSTRRARWPLDHHHGPNLPLFLSLSLSPSLLPVGTSLPSIFFLLALFILYLFYIEILPPPLSLSLSLFL